MIVCFQVFYWTCNRTKDCSMISRPHCYVDILTFNYTCTNLNRECSNNNNNNNSTTTVTRSYDFIMAMHSIESLSSPSFHLPLFLLHLFLLLFRSGCERSRDDVAGYEKEFNKIHIFYRVLFSRFLSIIFFFIHCGPVGALKQLHKLSIVKMVARFLFFYHLVYLVPKKYTYTTRLLLRLNAYLNPHEKIAQMNRAAV